MLIWDDARTYMRREAQIGTSDTDGVSFLNLTANQGYKILLAMLGRQLTEKVKTATSVAAQRGYQMPSDCAWVKNVSVVVGTTKYPLREVQSEQDWDLITQNDYSGIPQRFFYRPRFGIGGGILELDPMPGASTYTIRLTIEATDKDLSKNAYTTGTVTVANNSATVTGVGTTFTADMVGRIFQITSDGADRLWYRIKTFGSSTSLTLENVYEGASDNTLSYQIAEIFNIPEDLQMLPCYFALWQWYDTKKDPVQSAKYKGYWDTGIKTAKTTHGIKTRDNTVHYDDFRGPFVQAMPSYFPGEIT